jgi:hypothetical protein
LKVSCRITVGKIKNPAAPAVKHEAEEDWSTRQKTIAEAVR